MVFGLSAYRKAQGSTSSGLFALLRRWTSYLTVLTLDTPPAVATVFIPGLSIRNATFDCPPDRFVELSKQVIDPHSVDLVN